MSEEKSTKRKLGQKSEETKNLEKEIEGKTDIFGKEIKVGGGNSVLFKQCANPDCTNSLQDATKRVKCERCDCFIYCCVKCKKQDFQRHKKKQCKSFMDAIKKTKSLPFELMLSNMIFTFATQVDSTKLHGYELKDIIPKKVLDMKLDINEKAIIGPSKQKEEDDAMQVVNYFFLLKNEKITMNDTRKQFMEMGKSEENPNGLSMAFWSIFTFDMNEVFCFSFIKTFYKLKQKFDTELFIHDKENDVKYIISHVELESVRVNKKFDDAKQNIWRRNLPVYMYEPKKQKKETEHEKNNNNATKQEESDDEDSEFEKYEKVYPHLENAHTVVRLKIHEAGKEGLFNYLYLDFCSSGYAPDSSIKGSPFPVLLLEPHIFNKFMDVIRVEGEEPRSFAKEMKQKTDYVTKFKNVLVKKNEVDKKKSKGKKIKKEDEIDVDKFEYLEQRANMEATFLMHVENLTNLCFNNLSSEKDQQILENTQLLKKE